MSQPSPHRPRRDWKDAVIAAMGGAILLLGAVALRGKLPALNGDREVLPAGIHEVSFDRETLRTIDIRFDQPLGADRVGTVLGEAPATLDPGIGGAWKWIDPSTLRFEAAGQLQMATTYKISLIPERLVLGGKWQGDRVVELQTDRFAVERVELFEEPVPDEKGYVTLFGHVRFNYPVDPEHLAGKLALHDPASSEPSDIEIETTWTNEQINVRTGPIAKGDEERTVTLWIDGVLTPAHGNVPLGKPYEHHVQLGSAVRLTVRSVTVEPGETSSTIRVLLSSPADPDRAARYVKVTPEVEFRLAAERNVLELIGGFVPGKNYELMLAKGLPASDDAVLEGETRQTVAVPNLEPSLDFQSAGRFLAKTGHRTVAIESVNLDRAELIIDRVYRNNLFSLFQFEGWEVNRSEFYGDSVATALGDRIVEDSLVLRNPKNRKVTTPLDLDPYVDGEQPGLYRVAIKKAGEWQGSQRWLLITDLGMVAKHGLGNDGTGEIDVWVTSFANLAAVSGARVRLISRQNQPLADGVTDANGVWKARGLPTFDGNDAPYMVQVEKGDDLSFLLFDQSRIDTTGFDVGGGSLSSGGYSAFIYGERDLYRPSETAFGAIVIRDRRLAAPPTMPLVLRHRDPAGRERGDQRLTADSRGLVEWSLDLPSYAPTGHHSLALLVGNEEIGSYHFQVEEFVPDRIKVDITPPPAGLGPGAEVSWTVASQYLFGPPASGLPVANKARLIEAPFAPTGWETWSFANPERTFEPRELEVADGTLDEDGRGTFSTTLPAQLTARSGLELLITARVNEPGGRGVAAVTRQRVHPYPFYLGLRKGGEEFGEPGKPLAVEWVALDATGNPVKATNLRAELYRDEWNTVLRRRGDGAWAYESTRRPIRVDTQSVASGTDRGTLTFTPRDYGSYRAVLTSAEGGASASVAFYVSGWGYSPWAIESPAEVDLALDRDEYQPGETAKLLVKAPFAGKLIVTVERERVFWSETHTLDGNTGEIAIPIRAEYRPNAYVSVLLVRGIKDLPVGGVARAFGTIPLAVDRSANQLAVTIDVPEETRPEQPLTVKIATAPNAAVTISAVDEGILQLVAQKTPNPFAHFYAKLRLGVSAYDLFSQLFPEVDPKGPAGGGEDLAGMSQFLRTEGIRRVEPVAFWSGIVTADAQGKASATFAVPEFQGALRVMAVATRGDEFGSADRMLRVRTPLVLLPTFPRFLAYGDSASIPVGVRNDTGSKGDFTVTLTATGAAKVDGSASQTVSVDNARQETIYFAITTLDTGNEAKFTVNASGIGSGAGTKETSRSTAQLPVGPDLPARSRAQVGSFAAANTTLDEAAVGDFRTFGLTRELRIGPLPVLSLSGKLEDLLRYPYGCLEQTTSRAFPLLYFADLAKALAPEALNGTDPAVLIQEAMRRIGTMQVYDGGFAMWQGSEQTEPWPSLYASHFLVEAKRAGHPVEAFLYDQALEWVARQPNATADALVPELQRTAYALYILARAGKVDLGSMDFIRDRRKADLPMDSRALLAAAYAAVGNPKAVAELLTGLHEGEAIARQTGGNLDSTIRRRALLLLALLDAAPSDSRIPELADRLLRDATLGYWTTQESSFALLAVGQLARRQASSGGYRGKVYAGDELVGDFTDQPVRLKIPGSAKVRVEMASGYKPNAAFYALTTRGIPTDAAFRPESAGLEVRREIFQIDGTQQNPKSVPHGALLVFKTSVRSVVGNLDNVVIENLLPAGLEVENPRLTSSETVPWLACQLDAQAMDIRDDRVNAFTSLRANEWVDVCMLARATTPGTFRLPPVQAEAMYDPAIHATGERATLVVTASDPR